MRHASDPGEPIVHESAQFVSAESLRRRSDWFIKVRWVAALGVEALALVATGVAGIPLPLAGISAAAVLLVVLNWAYWLRNRRVEPRAIRLEIRMLKVQMATDLLLLTLLLNLTGGLENPFYFIYILHVLIASLLFRRGDLYQIALVSGLLFSAVVVGEYAHLLPHHHLQGSGNLGHGLPYVTAALISFWVVLVGAAYTGSSIMRHNRAIKDELVQRQRELEDKDRAKVDFFRFVSHEIKTPVVTAQSAVEAVLAVEEKSLAPRAVRMLERAVARMDQALQIVRDLTQLTRTEMRIEGELRWVDLKALLERLLAAQREQIANRGLTAQLDLPPEELRLRSDEGMVEKIFGNLISNAVRYNRPGKMLRVVARDQGACIRVTVEDQGIGIAPEEQERVFDEFYRTREAKEVSRIGTGLGLPIVKRFVDHLGGTLALRSKPGEGSTFTITLPKT